MNIEFSKTDKVKTQLSLLLFAFGSLLTFAWLIIFGVFTFFASEDLADARMQYEIVNELGAYFLLSICVIWSLIIYSIFILGEKIYQLQNYPSVEDKK